MRVVILNGSLGFCIINLRILRKHIMTKSNNEHDNVILIIMICFKNNLKWRKVTFNELKAMIRFQNCKKAWIRKVLLSHRDSTRLKKVSKWEKLTVQRNWSNSQPNFEFFLSKTLKKSWLVNYLVILGVINKNRS